jgi:hypothetical protein
VFYHLALPLKWEIPFYVAAIALTFGRQPHNSSSSSFTVVRFFSLETLLPQKTTPFEILPLTELISAFVIQ